jgi:hypothetical protein
MNDERAWSSGFSLLAFSADPSEMNAARLKPELHALSSLFHFCAVIGW